MDTLILSTRNPSKAEQIKALLKGVPFRILTLSEAQIAGEAVEDGSTLKENALKKARYARFNAGGGEVWSMADDTGLYIDILGGLPGIRAARWAGEEASTEAITNFTLSKLKGKSERGATFETTVALVTDGGKEVFFSGQVRGTILEVSRCRPQEKMPYSPIFQPEGSNKVWAEMSVEEENAISHRGKAFRQLRDYLMKLKH